MAKTIIITNPSGLVVEARKLKLRELDILGDEDAIRTASVFSDILAGITVGMPDPGPYGFDGKVDWMKVVQGDRYNTLIRARVHTFDTPKYDFDVPCTNLVCGSPARTVIPWGIDLLKRPVRKMSDADRAIFVAGNRFQAQMPDGGPKVWYCIPTGDTEMNLAKKRAILKKKKVTLSLLLRILEVEGVGTNAVKLQNWIEDLDANEGDWLLDEMEQHNCGVETTISVECQTCGKVQEVELPFGKTFWSPLSAKRQKVMADLEGSSDEADDPQDTKTNLNPAPSGDSSESPREP